MSHVIEVRGLTKHYGSTVGLDGLDLTVERGEVFGFLGPNGAGKTTTIRLLLDMIRPTRGSVSLFGRPSRDSGVRARVGYLPGELVLDERLTGAQNLEFLSRLAPRRGAQVDPKRRREICDRLGLARDDLRRPVRGYSRGMKQKVGLTAAMESDPDLLVLDEPTTGLDPLVRETVFELLQEAGRAGRTVFHSSHVLSEVDRTCSRVAIIREGLLMALHDVDELRRASARRMVVRFGHEPPIAELNLPGVSIEEREGSQVVLLVSGELDPLLRVLAEQHVQHLVFSEPSLEDAFVSYYRSSTDEAGS